MMTDKELKIGDFVHTRNICGDYKTYRVIFVDSDRATVDKNFNWKPKNEADRQMGQDWHEGNVDITIGGGRSKDSTFIQWDDSRNCWRTEITHKRGRRIQKNTPDKMLSFKTFTPGFMIHFNPHL